MVMLWQKHCFTPTVGVTPLPSVNQRSFHLLKKKEQKHKFVVFGNWSKKTHMGNIYYIISVKARAKADLKKNYIYKLLIK